MGSAPTRGKAGIGASNDLREADHGMERRRTLATAGPPSSFLYLHPRSHHLTTYTYHLHLTTSHPPPTTRSIRLGAER